MAALRCIITAPSGEVLEASPRLGLSAVASVTFAPENDLGIMHHGDMDLVLDNEDGAVKAFLNVDAPKLIYEVVLEREGPNGWSRVFGGILDIYSLSYDNKQATASVTAWSFSKMTEQASAETVTRPNAGIVRTASINSGTSQLVFPTGSGQASDLATGDQVTLSSLGVSQDFTIKRVLNADNAYTTEAASATITAGLLTLNTPFLADAAPVVLAQALSDACGLTLDTADFGRDFAAFPVPSPCIIDGLPLAQAPLSLVPHGTGVLSTWDAAGADGPFLSASPTSKWARSGGASNNYEHDWYPYLAAQPGTIYSRARGSTPGTDHDGNQIPLSVGEGATDEMLANVRVYTAGTGAAVGDQLDMRRTIVDDGVHYFYTLKIFKNNVAIGILNNGAVGPPDLGAWPGTYPPDVRGWLEWDSTNNKLWFSYQLTGSASPTPIYRVTGYIGDLGLVSSTQTLVETARSGQLRFAVTLGASGVMALHDTPWLTTTGPATAGRLRFYAAASRGFLGEYVVTEGFPQMWTLRHAPGYVAVVYQAGNAVGVLVLDAATLEAGAVTDVESFAGFLIAPLIQNFRTYLTVWTLTDGRKVFVGYAGGEWFVLSRRYDGVIRYADFSGRTCASALAALAAVTNSIVDVDEFKTLSLANRLGLGRGDVVRVLDVLLEDEERPFSDVYRASVEVAVVNLPPVVIGDSGDSAHRLSISSPLITTSGMAVATGVATWQFVSAIRSQREVDIPIEGDEPLRFGQRVTVGDKSMVVYKGQADLANDVQSLTLLEVIQ